MKTLKTILVATSFICGLLASVNSANATPSNCNDPSGSLVQNCGPDDNTSLSGGWWGPPQDSSFFARGNAPGHEPDASYTWDFNNVAMSGGASLVGSFTTNSAGTLLTFDIAVDGPPGGYLFMTGIPSDYITESGPTTFQIHNNAANWITFTFANSLSSSLSSDDITFSEFEWGDGPGSPYYSGNSGDADQVPEPASLMLLGSGLLALCFFARGRKAFTQASSLLSVRSFPFL
jgi:hypothetical protein